MAPLPKRKTSKARHRERASHWHLTAPGLALCPQCHSLYLPHRACLFCGTYRGREVIPIKAANPT